MKKPSEFEPRPGETILYQVRPNRKWYLVAWKVFSGLLALLVSVFMILAIASLWPVWLQVLAVAVISLLILGYSVEDIARLFTGECLLTDQRFWTRGSPYAWSPRRELPLAEIEAMTYRRDALFLRMKGSRKVQVYMYPDGKLLAQAFKQATGKDAPRAQV